MTKRVIQTTLGPPGHGRLLSGNCCRETSSLSPGKYRSTRQREISSARRTSNLKPAAFCSIFKGVLQGAGVSMGNVVRTTVFLKDMGDFADFNSVYAEFFNVDPPARSTVEVARCRKT